MVKLKRLTPAIWTHKIPFMWAILKASDAFAKLYTMKTAITSVDMLNDNVLPYFESQDFPILRILTDRGSEYCGKVENHDYELYLAINDIDHTKTKVTPQKTNGICERFHKTILQAFYQVAFRKRIYRELATLQADLDEWLLYNPHRTPSRKNVLWKNANGNIH